jgi:hypothetical protein
MALLGLGPSQCCSCLRVACFQRVAAPPNPRAFRLNVLLDGFDRGINRLLTHPTLSLPAGRDRPAAGTGSMVTVDPGRSGSASGL